MPTLEFSRDQIARYIGGSFEHPGYAFSIKKARELAIHALGLYPADLVENRRPSESEAVYEYRRCIFEPITEKEIGKVITELNKIRRSSDWSVTFDNKTLPGYLKNNGLSPESYLMTNYPEFDSIVNWAFSVLLQGYLIDANALVVTLPQDWNIPANELYSPVTEIVPSDRVIDYRPGDYAVYKALKECYYYVTDEKGITSEYVGRVIYIYDTMKFREYHQADQEGGYRLFDEKYHNLGYLPVTQTKGIVVHQIDGLYLFKSRISDMVPELNEAIREYSDLQAEVVTNIYSERWEYNSSECPQCKGTGSEKSPYGYCGECRSCKGSGVVKRGPYSQIVVKPNAITGQVATPMPPAGYIQKDTEIVKVQDQRVFNHLYAALAAINMQFLAQVPLNISGEAKSIDRDALNTFVNSIAEDLVSIMDKVCRFTIDMRYKTLIPDQNTRLQLLPVIAVPESFDMLSANYLLSEISTAQNNKVSPVIINALQREYASKKFNADPKIQKRLELTIKLDPLSGITEDDKLARLGAKGITLKTYILSSNIGEFIDRAIEEHTDNFLNLSVTKQKEILNGYADEQISATAGALVPPIDNNPNGN